MYTLLETFLCILPSFTLNRSTDPKDERPVKIIRLKYQNSPLDSDKVPPQTQKHKGRQLVFEDEVVGQPSDEVSQDKIVAAHGGESLADRDITEYEWAMQYVDSNKKFVLITTRNKGIGQLTKNRPFSYGRILRLDYEDPDLEKTVLLVECSKGVRKMWVSEDLLVKDSCDPESFRQEIAFPILITSLRPYIEVHVSLKERSPSQKRSGN